MDYIKVYDQLIERGLTRSSLTCYFEKHHIIPKCLGGSNHRNNIVNLTAREHFIVHWLLSRIYPNNSKIALAFYMMCQVRDRNQKRYIPSSRTYCEAKEKVSALTKGIKRPETTGSKNPMFGRVGELHPMFGKTLSKEQINKWLKSRENYKPSSETIKKISISMSYGNCYKAKPVTCYTTGKKFSCAKELSEFLGLSYTSVRRWLNFATPINFKYSYDQ